MKDDLKYSYLNILSESIVPSMLARLSEARTFQKMDSMVLQNGYNEIEVYSLTGNSVIATRSESGMPRIGINVSQVYYSGHFNPGLYDANGPGPKLFNRALPQWEVFAHELTHHAL